MSFLLIDNTKDLDNAKMTPLIINYFKFVNRNLIIHSKNQKIDYLGIRNVNVKI